MAFGLFTLLSSSLIGFGQVMLSIVILLSDYEYSIVFCLMVASFYLFLQVPFEIYSNNKRFVFFLLEKSLLTDQVNLLSFNFILYFLKLILDITQTVNFT